jgi:dimethylamine monooxygenase subunit A
VSIVFHNDPFTPFDRQPQAIQESPGASSGILRSVPIPDAFIPVAADALRLRVAARTLDDHQWVSVPDADWPLTIAMKKQLLDERRNEVVACTPGAEGACAEAAQGVLNSIAAALTSRSGIEALVDAALHIADDLCVLLPDDDGVMKLRAAVLCSPNRWRLAEKMNGTMASIHQPVARYTSDLDSPVNAVLKRLSSDRSLWRLSNHPALFQPDTPPTTPEMNMADMWVRIEWQTLRKLPDTGGVLFTIRTYVEQLSDFVQRDYQVVHSMSDLIAKIPEDVAVYKSIEPYRDAVVAYLDAR